MGPAGVVEELKHDQIDRAAQETALSITKKLRSNRWVGSAILKITPMYEARKICNLILSRFDAHLFNLTNLRLNKLLYFIHGHSLIDRESGLVRNHFEAWQYGPVVRVVYDAFKPFNERAITSPATFLDYSTGRTTTIPFDDIIPRDASFIVDVCKTYASYTTGKLVALSHQERGAWDTVFSAQANNRQLSPRISDDLIRREFLNEPVGKIQH